MKKVFKLFPYLVLSASVFSLALISSCGGEDEPTPDPPTITVTATGLVDGAVTGDIGTDVTMTIAVVADGGFESLTITEFQGTTELNSETFTTEVTTYTHTITDADFLNPFRVRFVVKDQEGQEATANVIVSVEATNLNKLLAYSWLFTSQIWSSDEEVGGDDSENIRHCETDNVYTFNADGTLTYNFGASSGLNGCEGSPNGCEGSCAGDGSANYVSWTFDEETNVLTVTRHNAETDEFLDELVWEILDFGDDYYVGRIDYDLSALFGFEFILTLDERWEAVPRED